MASSAPVSAVPPPAPAGTTGASAAPNADLYNPPPDPYTYTPDTYAPAADPYAQPSPASQYDSTPGYSYGMAPGSAPPGGSVPNTYSADPYASAYAQAAPPPSSASMDGAPPSGSAVDPYLASQSPASSPAYTGNASATPQRYANISQMNNQFPDATPAKGVWSKTRKAIYVLLALGGIILICAVVFKIISATCRFRATTVVSPEVTVKPVTIDQKPCECVIHTREDDRHRSHPKGEYPPYAHHAHQAPTSTHHAPTSTHRTHGQAMGASLVIDDSTNVEMVQPQFDFRVPQQPAEKQVVIKAPPLNRDSPYADTVMPYNGNSLVVGEF